MSDRARDKLNVTLFKYFIKYFHNLTCFPSSNLLSQLGHSFSGDLEEDIVFTPTVYRLFHPNCIVFSSMYSHCCSCDLVLVAKEINRLVSGRERTKRARLKFWVEFFWRKRVSLFKENYFFFFKISRMKVVYLGSHWQSDIRSWINLSNPKLEIQLLVEKKTETFCLFHEAVTLCCWQASIL